MKKLNKFFAVLVALAMMAMLSVTAFAAEKTDEGVPYVGAGEGKVVKYLVVPEGVTVPEVTNYFTFTNNTGASSGVTADELTVAKPADFNFKIDATADPSDDTTDGNSVVKAVALPQPDLTKIDHPGVYAYTLTESNAAITGKQDNESLSVNPDAASYTVRYSIVNKQGGGYEIKNITVQDKDGNKVTPDIEDPTTGKDTATTEDDNDGGASFKNIYTKTTGEEPEEPQDPDDPTPAEVEKFALRVTKTVDGEDAPATSEDFPFTLTLTAAVGQPATASYTYRIFDADNNLVKDAQDADKKGTITCGTPLQFTLKNGEYLALEEIPAGTRYAVSEDMNNAPKFSAYKPSFTVTTLDEAYNAADSTVKPAATSADLGQSLAAQNTGKTILLTENAKDVAAYTNTYDKNIDTPTGILISNLPYIALALVAIGGLVAYVVVRRRQDNEA